MAITKILSAIPGTVYAGVVILAIFGGIAAHLIIQRNDLRKELGEAKTQIETLQAANTTLRGNVATLESTVKRQNASIETAAQLSKEAQAQAKADLKAATIRAIEAEARNKAMRAIQEAGDKSKGGNYAHDARRARLLQR